MEKKLELEHFLPYRLARIAEAVSQDFARIYKQKAGLTRAEWRTLATIGQFDQVTASFVGKHSSMHKTKVSRAVASLETKRMIRRKLDPDDRRVEHLFLSSTGLALYRDLVEEARIFEASLLAKLGQHGAGSLNAGIDGLEANLLDKNTPISRAERTSNSIS